MTVATIETTDYLSTAEAARKINQPVGTVQRYCLNAEQGKTPAINGRRFGRSWFIHKDEIARYLKEKRGPGRPADD